MTELVLKFKLRDKQRELWDNLKRFNVLVCHRRFGKTVFVIMWLMEQAMKAKGSWAGYYCAPTFKQASQVAFPYLVHYASKIPGAEINRSELRVTFPNGAFIRLQGLDNGADHLRGLFTDALVIDETALVSSDAWSLVLRPMLADRQGRAIFIGTPMGRMSLFWDLFSYASSNKDPDWMAATYTVKDTNVLHPNELKAMKREMRPSEWEQEMMCSWDAAVLGAYYRHELQQLMKDNRFTTVRYDDSLPVWAALDLGYGDLTVWIIGQTVGNEVRLIDCVSFEQSAIPDQHRQIQELEYAPKTLLLPHDANVHELGTGTTRKQIFSQLGYNAIVVPKKEIADGIDITRQWLKRVWMDVDNCKVLVEALLMYRTEYDDVKRVFKTKPLHDWSSHYADAARYAAIGENMTSDWGSLDYRRLDRAAV